MKHITVPVGELSTNCYIVWDETAKKGIVIDPGAEGDRIINEIKKLDLSIEYVVFTHFHFDHVLGYYDIKKYFPALTPLVSEKEEPALSDSSRSLLMYANESFEKLSGYKTLCEGDEISFGNEKLRVIETPGHTEGSICLYREGILFSGDTLFSGSVGRWDFPGGSFKDEIMSVKNKLFTLPDNTLVFPGHGESTSIGYEKKHNSIVNSI